MLDRWDRWWLAIEASRSKAKELVGDGGSISQSEVSRRIAHLRQQDELREKVDGRPVAESISQKTISRFVSGEGSKGTNTTTLLAIFAVLPEVADAFEAALTEDEGTDAEQAAWSRIAARMAGLMTPRDALQLVDQLEDLRSLGALDTAWPYFLYDARFARKIIAANIAPTEPEKKERFKPKLS